MSSLLTGCSSAPERLWLEMWKCLSGNGLSLSVVVDCLDLAYIASMLVKRQIVTQSQVDGFMKDAQEDQLDCNRLLVNVAVHKMSKYRRFVEILLKKQVHIWYLSQVFSTGPKRK